MRIGYISHSWNMKFGCSLIPHFFSLSLVKFMMFSAGRKMYCVNSFLKVCLITLLVIEHVTCSRFLGNCWSYESAREEMKVLLGRH